MYSYFDTLEHSIWDTLIFQVPPVAMVNFKVVAVDERACSTYTESKYRVSTYVKSSYIKVGEKQI